MTQPPIGGGTAGFSIRRRSHNFEPVVFGECDAVRFQHVCNKTMEAGVLPYYRPRSSMGLLGVFSPKVVHVVANAVAKGMTDFPHTVESDDQAIAAVRW